MKWTNSCLWNKFEEHYESRLHFTIIIQVQFSSEILYVVQNYVIKMNCTKTCIFYTKFQMEIRYSVNFFLAKFQRESFTLTFWYRTIPKPEPHILKHLDNFHARIFFNIETTDCSNVHFLPLNTRLEQTSNNHIC